MEPRGANHARVIREPVGQLHAVDLSDEVKTSTMPPNRLCDRPGFLEWPGQHPHSDSDSDEITSSS